MTQRLYYDDVYIKDFTARVVSCVESGGSYEVVLDRTAFFPEGGGQPADNGFIGGAKVFDVHEKGSEVVHCCSEKCPVGAELECRIDYERRFDHMQQHTGEHIFSGFVHSVCGFENVGFHMGESSVTVDFNGVVSPEELRRIERLANEAIYKNIYVETLLPSTEELENYSYRSKKELQGQVRLVRIEGVDLCACCGTHVSRTGEVGMIKAVASAHYKSGVRIALLIGRRALADYGEKNDSVYAISNLLCAKTEEVAPAVERLREQLKTAQYEYSELKKRLFALESENASEGFELRFDPSGSAEDARIFADMLAEKAAAAAVFSGSDGSGYKYAVVSRTEDVRPLGKELNSALGGRGGGKPEMIQGSVSAARAEIEAFFNGKK